jgi:hypothetical protein
MHLNRFQILRPISPIAGFRGDPVFGIGDKRPSSSSFITNIFPG